MSPASNAAGAGAVLAIVLVFLLQQFGFLSLSGLVGSIIAVVTAAVVGGVAFGLVAFVTGRPAKRVA